MDLRLLSMAWIVLLPNEDDADTHVVPGFGPAHLESVGCWCEPVRDTEDESVIIHNAVH